MLPMACLSPAYIYWKSNADMARMARRMRRLSLCVLMFFVSGALSAFPADRVWVGGSSSNWFDEANWEPAGVPLPTESVYVSNITTIVLADSATVRALELRRATLVVSNQLIVTNLFVSDGARLSAWVTRPNPITNPPPDKALVEIPPGGTFQITDKDNALSCVLEGIRLNLRGSGSCTNRSSVLLFYRSELNVFGSLELTSEFTFDGANGPPAGSLNVYGTLRRPSGTNVSLVAVGLTNRGTILLQSGTFNIGLGVSSGVFNTSSGATQSFVGTFQLESGASFTGGGMLRLVRGTFDCGSNDVRIPNLHFASPGMTLQGSNNTISATETYWENGDLAGSGDFVGTSHLNVLQGSPGTPGKRVLGTRRIVNRGKMVFGSNAVVSFLERSSLRNEAAVELGQGSGMGGFAAAAPHPDVCLLNMGILYSTVNTTNSISIRCTNYGRFEVNGRLQLLDKNSIQKDGTTTVEGMLSAPVGYRVDGGILKGNGIVQGILRNAATISPGSSPGMLTISGTLTNNGLLTLELAIGTNDLISVSNHFRFGGTIAVTYPGDTWPPDGTSWEILKFGSSSGNFQNIEGLDLGGGHILHPIFSPTNLVLVLSNQAPTKYVFTTVRTGPQQLELHFTGDPDTTYSIDTSSNLVSWSQLVQTNRPDGILYLRNITTTQPQIFYRARAIQ
jgi:hypothetical protein